MAVILESVVLPMSTVRIQPIADIRLEASHPSAVYAQVRLDIQLSCFHDAGAKFAALFVFDNPNAKGACGCGESFAV